ncbi:FG-GAP repeat domain-containing protein [Sorangium sp. So ce1335]|uniref:FG-GAP repeat domain-containing protein n=1 Tax=Sorangium sp. So ce1335 TaxID=3133335 RepID=UPI003F61686C
MDQSSRRRARAAIPAAHFRELIGAAWLAALCAGGCSAAAPERDDLTGTASAGGADAVGEAGGAGAGVATGGVGGDDDAAPAIGAEGGLEGSGVSAMCKIEDGDSDDALPICSDKAPADSFTPVVQWEWTAPPAVAGSYVSGSMVTPLVGNFTDDNGDGNVDLCDVPDILVTAIDYLPGTGATDGTLYLLAGDTGAQQVVFEGKIDSVVSPAFGDIDGDGLPEVVTASPTGWVVAYENDGTLAWTGDLAGYRQSTSTGQCAAAAIYDLDGDGKPEILLGWEVFDNRGRRLFGDLASQAAFDTLYWCATPTAADLDGDGKLEVIFGNQAVHHDGTLYWGLDGFLPGHPQVANLDGDPEPEIFFTNPEGMSVIEHDGTVKFGPVRLTDPSPSSNCWGKPAVVTDFDGDGIADVAAATCTDYSVYGVGEDGFTLRWSAEVFDVSGLATATAFDFLGDGVAEAIYADEQQIYVFDGETGEINLTWPRTSATLIEYPVVADVDNDASAEIVYVSSYLTSATGPTITVLRDVDERWIPARRIWNQYAYHVTNVREDGTIPENMKKSWQQLNSFRTNSQISSAGFDCSPEPPR